MRILTPEAMREVDRVAIEEYGIPGLVLMENAALAVADAVGERFPEASSVALFCGPGNNGGDGLAAARHLGIRGYDVQIFLASLGKGLSTDAARQLAICRRQGLPIWEIGGGDAAGPVLEAALGYEILVDALFGTGLGRPLEGLAAELVTGLNRLPRIRLAIDLPSGLDGSRGAVFGPHFHADLTVALGAPKVAHLFAPAADAVGELAVADLGMPPRLLEEAPGGLHLLTAEELAGEVRPRAADSHKGTFGHLLLVAGSPGKAGAAVLAARAAVRGGAGLVSVAVPEPILATVDLGSLESMTIPLAARPAGGLDRAAGAEVLAALDGKDAMALGPGLGREPETTAAIRQAVLESEAPLVLDADGLNAFAGEPGLLAGREGVTILTPHPGELARLLGIPVAEILEDRVEWARRAAAATGAIAVLKGHQTLVAEPVGDVYLSPTGNPGMATGGVGDVLTGLLGALLAQGYDGRMAALLGVYLHGLAGDLAAARRGEEALRAGDLVASLPAAFQALRGQV